MDILCDVMGMKAEYREWNKTEFLPLYISAGYDFNKAVIDGIDCIMLKPKGELPYIQSLKKQISKIQETENIPVVLRLDGISVIRRKSLIENRIPFVSDRQVYLPFMAALLNADSEKYKQQVEKLTVSAQMLALVYLYSSKEQLYITEARKKLPFSAMSMTRAARILEDTGLFTLSKDGVNRIIYGRHSKYDMYEKLKKYMRSPVKTAGYIDKNKLPEEVVFAGDTALSARSMLGADDFKTFATAPGFDTAAFEKELVDIKKQCRLEVWKYDPYMFSYDGFADPVSVALSLEKTSDERIQISIDEMIKKIWR